MAKKNKDTKFSKAAHIKRYTEGTSNELSFSVLDAKKNQADAEGGLNEKAKIPVFGKASIFARRPGRKKPPGTPTKEEALPLSGGEVSSSASLPLPNTRSIGSNPEREIEKRKTRRKRRRVLYAAAAVLLLVEFIGGGAYYLYNEVTAHQAQVSLLDQSLSKLDEADKTIVGMDEQVTNLSSVKEEDIENTLSTLEGARTLLDESESLANDALTDMRDSVEKEVAQQAVQATQSRKEMISFGEPLLRAELAARDDTEQFQDAWDVVLEADEAAREAAEAVTDTTRENVELSKEKSEEAIELFEDGLSLFETTFSASIFTYDELPLTDYISKRIEALNYAVASNNGILEQNREEAQTQNDAYNTADEEASDLAKNLPDDMSEMVGDAFETYTGETYEHYKSARQSASTADAFLRDYLGT